MQLKAFFLPWHISCRNKRQIGRPMERAMEMISSKAVSDAAAWQTRVDLAAAHRLAVMHGFNEGIFNHLTARVPGRDDRYLQIPFGTYWSEVTASCFMEVGFDGKLLAGSGEIEDTCFAIHMPIHRALERAVAVLHTHMPYASALSRLEDPRILPTGQTELSVALHTVYGAEYEGLVFDSAEGEHYARLLGEDKNILMMSNHGVLVIGRSVAEAYDRLFYLERAAQVQLYAMWTGQRLKYLPNSVIETTQQNFRNYPQKGGKPNCEHHFAALKRILDRREPDYPN
jgi:ribulose-5-phosphate 4-epimerase/fuculose-1-phosphate aldolase